MAVLCHFCRVPACHEAVALLACSETQRTRSLDLRAPDGRPIGGDSKPRASRARLSATRRCMAPASSPCAADIWPCTMSCRPPSGPRASTAAGAADGRSLVLGGAAALALTAKPGVAGVALCVSERCCRVALSSLPDRDGGRTAWSVRAVLATASLAAHRATRGSVDCLVRQLV